MFREGANVFYSTPQGTCVSTINGVRECYGPGSSSALGGDDICQAGRVRCPALNNGLSGTVFDTLCVNNRKKVWVKKCKNLTKKSAANQARKCAKKKFKKKCPRQCNPTCVTALATIAPPSSPYIAG